LPSGSKESSFKTLNQNPVEILYKSRAIVIQENNQRYLVVSDLHIGFEEKFRIAGISIQSKIDRLALELEQLIEQYKICNLLINGDVKSGTDRITRYEWENVPKFFERMMKCCHVSVVPGNHDGGLHHLLPPEVTIHDPNGVMVSNILILHGHTSPLAKFRACEKLIMGHVHPIFQRRGSPLSGQPVWIFLRTTRKDIFKESLPAIDPNEPSRDLEIILMPSFNLDLVVAGFAIDTAKQERKIAPVLRYLKNIREALITTLDGDLIGDASMLEDVI
jgi:putative SbcD/Mre11-related phosphoesterase